jgi:hypothetical protein
MTQSFEHKLKTTRGEIDVAGINGYILLPL